MTNDDDLSLTERVFAIASDLSPSEAKVASVVLDSPRAVLSMGLSALARKAGVSDPTVVRFYTSLGFSGFKEFQVKLAEAIAVGRPVRSAPIRPGDSVAAISRRIFDDTISSLDRTRKSLDIDSVEAAVDAILEAKTMLLIGMGSSGVVAQDAMQKSAAFGLPCLASLDLHEQFKAAAMGDSGLIVLAVSNSGRSKEILGIAREAQKHGSKVIGVSGSETPLTELADIPIILRTYEDTDGNTPAVSRLAGEVLVDVLAVSVAMRRGPVHLAKVAAMQAALAAFRAGVLPDEPSRVVEDYSPTWSR